MSRIPLGRIRIDGDRIYVIPEALVQEFDRLLDKFNIPNIDDWQDKEMDKYEALTRIADFDSYQIDNINEIKVILP